MTTVKRQLQIVMLAALLALGYTGLFHEVSVACGMHLQIRACQPK